MIPVEYTYGYRRLNLVHETHKTLLNELDDLKKGYNATKNEVRFKNNKKYVKNKTLENKALIVSPNKSLCSISIDNTDLK